jgi:hypothetical protein
MTDNVNADAMVPSDSVHFDEIDVILREADMAARRPVLGHFRRILTHRSACREPEAPL